MFETLKSVRAERLWLRWSFVNFSFFPLIFHERAWTRAFERISAGATSTSTSIFGFVFSFWKNVKR